MIKHILITLGLIYFISSSLFSQNYPQDYFRSPLDIPLYLSGNFGELRSNHFHAGIDIKTQGVEGKKIFAVADGYVSRIKVSPYGYGKAIYVTHPNGYTSVYGHLQKYSDKIAKIVEEAQYREEKFDVQLFPAPYAIQVKKGEIIAYSGNTGGSGGPHLHFEIRDTKTEHPINPLFFGFDVKDQRKPDIYAITIYPLNDTSLINGSNLSKRYTAKGANGNYRLASPYPISLHGLFGFGIETVDRMSGTHNSYGLHNIKLNHNNQTIFEQQIDEFAFHEGRYINAHIDFANYIQQRRRVQRSFVLPGNKLRFYKTLVNDGKILFNDGTRHEMEYILSDLNGNQSTLNFTVEAQKTQSEQKMDEISNKKVRYFPYNQRNSFIQDDILVDLPKGILYEDIYFQFRKEENHPKTISPIYWIHDHHTPLHSYMTVSIKKSGLSAKQKKQALIVSTTNGKSFYAEGGEWNGDNIRVKSRSFGGYAIAIDSIPPQIIPINIYPGANMSNRWSISIKIQDNLSGINSYRAEIDGKWVLMEYDYKKDMLYYFFDEKVKEGKHNFKLVVTDGVNNKTVYEAAFVR
ncbi:MAG: peptidase M23 [Flavobacteriales bacterium]|nr:peptidase M23 [Flavobacteriales bacterium]|tara:strand:+ start:3187 stop:4911 length:1725 start_codon:yes stop_codon:yes gene_type:complete